MEELSCFLYLKDASHELSRKNLADLMDLSRGDLAVAVQRLSAKKDGGGNGASEKAGNRTKDPTRTSSGIRSCDPGS